MNRYLTQPEERQLLAHVKKFAGVLARRDHAWMRLMRQTGIRVGTMAGLTVGDAREALRTGYLVIRGEIAKRKQGHSVFLNRSAVRAMRDLLAVRREQDHAEHPDAPLVVSRQGKALAVRTYQHRMRTWSRDAGLPVDASPHWWRHTLAMRLMRESTARDPRGTVMSALGHRSINSTAQYTGPSREDVEQALAEVSS